MITFLRICAAIVLVLVGSLGMSTSTLAIMIEPGGWISQMPGQFHPPLYAVSFRGQNGLGVGLNGTAFRTADAGRTWVASPVQTQATLYDVFFSRNAVQISVVNPDGTAWAVGANGTILKTMDAGWSWNVLPSGTIQALNSVSFVGTEVGWVVGDHGTLLKTTDGGSTWVAQRSGTEQALQSVHALDTDRVWAVGHNGTILKTLDGGTTWMPLNSRTSEHLWDLTFADTFTGYASGVNNTLLKTTDGGVTWFSLSGDLPVTAHWTSVSFLSSSEGWVVGTTDKTLHTVDGGMTWTVKTVAPNAWILDVFAQSSSAVWSADATQGIVYRYDNTPPTVPGGLTKSPGSDPSNIQSPTFTWTASSDAESRIQSYEISVDHAPFLAIGDVTNYVPAVPFTEGAHTFEVRAVDVAGNASTPASKALTVDITPPTVSAVSPREAVVEAPLTMSATVGDASGMDSCDLYVNNESVRPMGLAGANKVMTVYAFASVGTQSVSVRCWDRAGNSAYGPASNVVVNAAPLPDTGVSRALSLLSVSPLSVPADGGSLAYLTATVRNAAGSPLSGKTVSVSSSRGALDTIASAHLSSDVNGRVTFSIRSSRAGIASLSVVADGVALGSISVSFSPWPAADGSPSVARLVKLACPTSGKVAADHACKAVYYVGSDQVRHAFPHEKIYFTWYADFSNVATISADTMAAYRLGKNVTYRPGIKMVKFQTLDRVYAVSRGGVLRWIGSEAVARALYGVTWNKQIDDISDAFFLDYRFGADILATQEYVVAQETASAATIEANFSLLIL